MSTFILRGASGGSYLRDGDLLRDDGNIAASLACQASVSAGLTTAIRAAATLAAVCTVTAALTTSIRLQAAPAAQTTVTGTLSDFHIPLPPDRALRSYEQFIQGPVGSPAYNLGTVDSYRSGVQYTANLSNFFAAEDGGATPDFGFLGGSAFEVDVVSTQSSPIDLAAVATALRDQVLSLVQVTRFTYADGSTSETLNARRAVVKKTMRKRNVLTLSLADVDRTALDVVFPLNRFAVADFPNLFAGHVGRLVTEGVGTVVRVPLTWIDNAGPHVFAGPRVIAGVPGTLLTVYRGSSEGQGPIVDASEYSTGTATGASSGIVVNTVAFAREQVDFSGNPYVMEADYLLPGSRKAPDEIARILALYGITADASTVADAAAFDASAGILVDCLHGGGEGRTGAAVIGDLLRIARAWLLPTSSGAWAMAQDRPQLPMMQFRADVDEIDVSEYGDGDRLKTVTVDYRPKFAGLDSNLERTIQRTTGAASGELNVKAPFVRDDGVADRLASYHQKRLASLAISQAATHAVQLDVGKVVAIAEPLIWSGFKYFLIEGNKRGADVNDLELRETADLYSYTPGTLPADATNGYGPDYSFTPPVAPTIHTPLAAGTTSTDSDGKVRAAQLIQLTPPTVNWALLTVQLTDTTTTEIYQAQALLNSGTGFYEATIANLPPGRAMQARAWATNANNLDGAVAGPVAFTSGTDANVPAAPVSAVVTQNVAKEMHYAWTKVTAPAGSPPTDEYIVEESVNNSSFSEIWRGKAISFERMSTSTGNSYKFRVRVKNKAGTEGPSTTSNQVTSGTTIDDSYIVGQGVGGGSIANGAINQGRTTTGTITLTGTTPARIALDEYSFFPNIYTSGGALGLTSTSVLAAGTPGVFAISGGPLSYSVAYRNFSP